MEHATKEEIARFDSCWVADGECKLWKRALDKDGYGTFYFRKKGRRAHRVAYYMEHGPIAEGMVIDHIGCRNRKCVAVEHLRMVTASVNAIENSNSVAAVNRRKTTCKLGHPLDKTYGSKGKKQRYCSVCASQKRVRLAKKWREEANAVKC